MQRLAVFFSLALVAAVVAAQPESAARSYRIGTRDVVQVRVEELPEVAGEHVVAEDGTLVLPVVGTVEAQGLSEEQLARRLQARLEDRGMRTATVTVLVTTYRSRPVSILGAVADPGNHYLSGRATLMDMLMEAGGLAADHGDSIYVRRRADNGLSDQIEIPVRGLIEVGDPALNVPIFAGDHINVPQARQITVHFLGQVQTPGSLTFPASRGVTLLTAIAQAGGLLETASKKIRIQRRSRVGALQELVIDYRDVLNRRVSDPVLEDGDLIVVKESFF